MNVAFEHPVDINDDSPWTLFMDAAVMHLVMANNYPHESDAFL